MNPKVSVIVPIYGVEKYLRQCVDSILAQTLKEIEVILVDDGSPDGCPAIVDEYAAKDSRVIAVHQENGGYGRAVNHGIDLAKGEYIGIIESDDWIEPTMYEKLYRNAEENGSDLVKAQFYIYNSAKSPADKLFDNRMQTLHDAPDGVFSIEEWPKLFIYHASIWANLYRAGFLKNVRLIETRSASYQDFPFMCECYCRAQFISVVKEPLVHYRMEEGQQSSTIRRDERLLLMADQCMNGREILKRYGKFEALKDEFHFHAYAACAGFYRNVHWKHKLAYMRRIRTMMSESGDISLNPYLTSSDRRVIRHIKSSHLIRSLFTFKEVRRMLFAVKISRSGFAITFLGIRLICGECKDRPSLVTIRIYGRGGGNA